MRWQQLSSQVPQVLAIPRRRDALARRVRPGFIRARGDASLAQLAHVPILFVNHVPKLNRIVGFKSLRLNASGLNNQSQKISVRSGPERPLGRGLSI
jgi:hypothetical protein